jgi:glycosyltransferase involved in cell wall biosynthesis
MKVLITIPVYNEELVLEKNIKKLFEFCVSNLADREFIIVIVNNNSSDRTGTIADELSTKYREVEHMFISSKGKGLAISSAWKKYDVDAYFFMDVDLATDISAIPEALKEIELGTDVVIGSRFHRDSKVDRTIGRKIISHCYRLFFKTLFKVRANDMPCGFKVINKKVRNEILGDIKDTGFFWDTEMLVLANKRGFDIKEIPIIWSEFIDPERKSTVNITGTAINYIKKSLSLKMR